MQTLKSSIISLASFNYFRGIFSNNILFLFLLDGINATLSLNMKFFFRRYTGKNLNYIQKETGKC